LIEMKWIVKIVIFMALAVGVSSAAKLSKIDKEYTKSVESGKLKKLYSKMGDLDGRNDSVVLSYTKQAGVEMERFAKAGSDLAICDLANFYGPQPSNLRYQSNYNLALQWLIAGETKGFNCAIDQGSLLFADADVPEDEYSSSLEYLVAALELNFTPKEIKKDLPNYRKAKAWIAERKKSKMNGK
jgi:hypothetical protein